MNVLSSTKNGSNSSATNLITRRRIFHLFKLTFRASTAYFLYYILPFRIIEERSTDFETVHFESDIQ